MGGSQRSEFRRLFPMVRHILEGIAVGIVLIAALLIPSTKVPASNTSALIGKTAPDFTLTDSKGASLKLSNYKGRVVLLNFWATWCHGCKLEIPWFIDFED